jgi:cytochrome oxidase assembly protein ShyY1
MLGVLALLAAAAVVCGLLGTWQLDRAQVRGAAAEAEREAELAAADPVPLTSVLAPQTTFTGALVGRKVSVTGRYEADGQLLVTGRALDGREGVLVLTPLRVDSAGGAVLPVVRGWLPAGAAAPEPPAGDVDVIAYLQAGESAAGPIADGTTEAISPAQLLGVWDGPIWTGYAVLASSSPAQGDDLALLDPPTMPGSGLNVQNLAYALQWWIFGGFALLVWWRMVRDEARDLAEREAGQVAARKGGPDEGPDDEGPDDEGPGDEKPVR